MNDALNFRGSKILHISHRGGSFENFENSQLAFKNAVKKAIILYNIINFIKQVVNCDTDIIETDVCLTKDEKVVCFHDNNMKRLCGIDQDIQTVNFSEIKYSS